MKDFVTDNLIFTMESQLKATPRSNLVYLKNIPIKTYSLTNILGKLVMKPNTNQEQSRIKIGKSCISIAMIKGNLDLGMKHADRLKLFFMPIQVAFLIRE